MKDESAEVKHLTTIDKNGKVYIPKELRETLGLAENDKVVIAVTKDGIILIGKPDLIKFRTL